MDGMGDGGATSDRIMIIVWTDESPFEWDRRRFSSLLLYEAVIVGKSIWGSFVWRWRIVLGPVQVVVVVDIWWSCVSLFTIRLDGAHHLHNRVARSFISRRHRFIKLASLGIGQGTDGEHFLLEGS